MAAMIAGVGATTTPGFRHEALIYANAREFLEGTVPFILEGVAAGEPVLAVVPEPRVTALRVALGGAAASVLFADMSVVGRNPARIIPVWSDFVEQQGTGGQPVRGIGEPVWPGRRADEIAECLIHEALLNVAFAGPRAVTILCPYDESTLVPSIIEDVHGSHDSLRPAGAYAPSTSKGASLRHARPFDGHLDPCPANAEQMNFDVTTLARLRNLVASIARHAGLTDDRVDDLVLAVSELAANSVSHGGGSGTARAWTDGTTVWCEVTDRGRIDDVLAGRRRPRADQLGGRGLWLTNQVCDLVQIRVGPDGTAVRIHQHVANEPTATA